MNAGCCWIDGACILLLHKPADKQHSVCVCTCVFEQIIIIKQSGRVNRHTYQEQGPNQKSVDTYVCAGWYTTQSAWHKCTADDSSGSSYDVMLSWASCSEPFSKVLGRKVCSTCEQRRRHGIGRDGLGYAGITRPIYFGFILAEEQCRVRQASLYVLLHSAKLETIPCACQHD